MNAKMPCREAQQQNAIGKLIALEGDSEVISTHLRLLPPSQKILVFPPLQECISQASEQRQFDPKDYIRGVHADLAKRLETARSFLQSSTSTQHPKLVFMNGGTLRARAICIENICHKLTLGDIGAAEVLFYDLVKEGMAGLFLKEEKSQEDVMISENTKVESLLSGRKEIETLSNDPSVTKNMTDTEGLKHPDKICSDEGYNLSWTINGELIGDQHHEKGQQKTSQPSDLHQTSLEELVADILDPVTTRPDLEQRLRDNHDQVSNFKKKANSVNCEQLLRPKPDESSKEAMLLRRRTFEFDPNGSPSFTANNYLTGVYVEDESDNSNELEFFSSDPSLSSTPSELLEKKSHPDLHAENEVLTIKQRRSANFDSTLRRKRSLLLPSLIGQSRQKKSPCAMEISTSKLYSYDSKISPSTFLRSPQKSTTESFASSPLHLGSEHLTHYEKNLHANKELGGIERSDDELNKPVFELIEDLVIHFKDGSTDLILESVLQSHQDSRYPSFRPSDLSVNPSGNDQSEIPSSPVSGLPERNEKSTKYSRMRPPNTSSLDPFNSSGSAFRSQKLSPPTPSMTPPMTSNIPDKTCNSLVTFSAANSKGIISVHNCFRRLLSNHFPAGVNGYSQYYWPISPEADRLWKPVFGNWNVSECLLKKTTVDRIIAFGCESSVSDDFRSQISGMIERVGFKKNGDNRSSKLDIGYLISNAMQNINDLTIKQNTFVPLSEPSLVATLIIPQLESYFASNSLSQLLVLQFSSTHIPIIYALRELLGNNLFKIAGIVTPPNPISTTFPPSPVSPNTTLTGATANHSMKFGKSYSHTISSTINSIPSSISTISKYGTDEDLSGVDYVLSSVATDDEIIRFISGIRQSLIEISNFYIPEPEPEPRTIVQVVEKYISTPTPNYPMPSRPSSQHRSSAMENSISQDGVYRPNSRRQSNKTKRHSSSAGLHNPLTEFIARRNYATSIASSRRTHASNMSGDLDGWENFEIGDDENDFDDYDRMILGSKMAGLVLGRPFFGAGQDDSKVIQHRVASKRKALKWLGLA